MKRKMSVRNMVLSGLFAAMAMALSFAESWLPPLPIPGVRLGLANVAVTAAVWLLGAGYGGGVAVAKVLFVLLTRGVTAGMMSACGTVLAVAAMIGSMSLVRRDKMTFVGVSITAACLHTTGQLVCASLLLSTTMLPFAPPMLLVSLGCGIVTGFVLNVTIPRLQAIVLKQM